MKKDTVYIDTEDDITVILGKIKDSDEKLVALVPPKRVGVLQSAVNLRLLKRAAKQAKKHLVLVTNDSALRSLAAVEQLPVAKTLQSKPEVPEVPTIDMDDGDDIIDGASLPVSDHVKHAGQSLPDEEKSSEKDQSDSEAKSHDVGAAAVALAGEKDVKKAKKSKPKVPNFNKVRKRAVIIGILALLLIVFLVWAIKFAPRATVNIQASTIEESLNLDVSLQANAEPSLDEATLPVESRQTSDQVSVDITPTGSKNVGERATGVVRIKGRADAMLYGGVTIPAGTTVTSSGGSEFQTDSAVSLEGISGYEDGATVGVTASERGENYNGASGSASIDAQGVRSVAFTDATSGGTDKQVDVITDSDVEKAMTKVDQQLADNDKQAELAEQFGEEYIVLEGSFESEKDDIKPSPAVGEEVSGQAKLSGEVTYTLYAVPKQALGQVLDEYFKQQIEDEPNQRIYDNGVDQARFMTTEESDDNSWTSTLIATAKVGPDIKDDQVKEVAKGKKFDEIRSALESINGVEQATTDFWPFWVNKAPADSERITVIFDVDDKD